MRANRQPFNLLAQVVCCGMLVKNFLQEHQFDLRAARYKYYINKMPLLFKPSPIISFDFVLSAILRCNIPVADGSRRPALARSTRNSTSNKTSGYTTDAVRVATKRGQPPPSEASNNNDPQQAHRELPRPCNHNIHNTARRDVSTS